MVGNRKMETARHSILKHLFASVLERLGHKVAIEQELGSKGIADIVDWTEGIAYEIQTKQNKKAEKKKLENYLLYSGLVDVIFIYVKDYDFTSTIAVILNKIERKLGIGK